MDRRPRFLLLPKALRFSFALPSPMWPPGWRALIWQTLLRLTLVGLFLAFIAAIIPLPEVPKAPSIPTTPPHSVHNLQPVARTRSRNWNLETDPFRADRRFPPVIRSASLGKIPLDWQSLPRQQDPRLLLFGVAGSTGDLKALVGTMNHESWQTVGATVDNWHLVAIRPRRILWVQSGSYAVSSVIEIRHPQMDRPRPVPLFSGGHG